MSLEIHVVWILFGLGLGLLSCELFVPGGFVGVVGFLMVGAAIVGSVYKAYYLSAAAMTIVVLIVVPVGIWYALKRFSLPNELSSEKGFTDRAPESDLMGRVGRSLSPLRPSGTAEFDGQRITVMAETGMIDAEQKITVVKVEGNRVFVRATDES